jgi:hypothetical protein
VQFPLRAATVVGATKEPAMITKAAHAKNSAIDLPMKNEPQKADVDGATCDVQASRAEFVFTQGLLQLQ